MLSSKIDFYILRYWFPVGLWVPWRQKKKWYHSSNGNSNMYFRPCTRRSVWGRSWKSATKWRKVLHTVLKSKQQWLSHLWIAYTTTAPYLHIIQSQHSCLSWYTYALWCVHNGKSFSNVFLEKRPCYYVTHACFLIVKNKIYWSTWRKTVNLDNLQKYSDWGFNPPTHKKVQGGSSFRSCWNSFKSLLTLETSRSMEAAGRAVRWKLPSPSWPVG